MANELGKIEKLPVEQYKEGRKIYLVTLVYSTPGAPADYLEIFQKYWADIAEHLSNLENKVGKVKKIYHESLAHEGEEGLKVLERLNSKGYELVKVRCEEGAAFVAVEDRELVGETPGEYSCAVHAEPWYHETPCFAHGQIEQSPDAPCRMGEYVLNRHHDAQAAAQPQEQ